MVGAVAEAAVAVELFGRGELAELLDQAVEFKQQVEFGIEPLALGSRRQTGGETELVPGAAVALDGR